LGENGPESDVVKKPVEATVAVLEGYHRPARRTRR
jgi:hypothetical protein